MATNQLTAFIPTIWAARLNANLDKNLVLGAPPILNMDYAGNVTPGGTVNIQRPTNLVSAPYDPVTTTIVYGAPAASTTTLLIDQRQYVAFQVDDLDAVQSNINLVNAYTERASYALKDAIDKSIANLYTAAGAGDVAVLLASGDMYATLVAAGKNLDLKNVPRDGRWVAVSPAGYAKLLGDTKFTQANALGASTVVTGSVGMVAGFTVFVSNNLINPSTTVFKYLYGTGAAITHARALIGEPEPIRLEGKFGTGVRMEYAWGSKLIEPNALGTISATE